MGLSEFLLMVSWIIPQIWVILVVLLIMVLLL